MIRKLIVLGVVAGALTAAGSASADGPTRGLVNSRIILDADRLMPLLTYESVTLTDPNNSANSVNASSVSAALLTNGAQSTFYTLPRLGFDVVVTPNFTVGASAWVYTNLSESATLKVAGASISQDRPKTTYWGVAPRVGYILPLTDYVAFWPRAGIEYHKENTNTVTVNGVTSGGAQVYQFAVDLDAALVFTPADHLGFTLTGYAAIPLVGGANVLPNNLGVLGFTDLSELGVGLTVGMLGYL
jgi:hypothetical protein